MENEETLRAIRKELTVTKICCVFSMLLTLCLIVGVGVVCIQIMPILEMADTLEPVVEAVDEVQPVLEELSELDVDQLNTLLSDVKPVLEQLSEIDTDALNELIGNLDPEELQQTLDGLSSAMDTVNSISDKLSGLGSLFK